MSNQISFEVNNGGTLIFEQEPWRVIITHSRLTPAKRGRMKGERTMIRYYIFKDGALECSAGTKEAAMDVVRMYQEREQKAHQWLWANFSIITGEEECIPYPKQKRNKKAV